MRMDKIKSRTITGTQTGQIRARDKRGWHIGRWLARFVLLACFLAGFYLSVFPSGRALVRSLAILPGVLTAEEPSWEAPVAEPISHTQMTLQSSAGIAYLDVYAPTTSAPPVPGAREGLLVIPGIGDQRKDAQLINFSQTLARSGVVVMNLTTPMLINLQLDAADEASVVQAFHVLQHWPGVGRNRVGLFGISAGGALICLAAADSRIQKEITSVTLFGSYFNVTTLLQAIGRRSLDIDGHVQPWQPVYFPMQVLADTLAPLLPANDAASLENAFGLGGHPLTAYQVTQLTPASAAVYHLLDGDEPTRVNANLAELTPDLRALLDGLSPSRVVAEIRAPIYLLHDRSDQYVPVTESREFAAELAKLHHPYDFAEVGVFQHTEVRPDLAISQLLGDGQSLLRLLREVMQASS
jgi:dienelactone hydrolase